MQNGIQGHLPLPTFKFISATGGGIDPVAFFYKILHIVPKDKKTNNKTFSGYVTLKKVS